MNDAIRRPVGSPSLGRTAGYGATLSSNPVPAKVGSPTLSGPRGYQTSDVIHRKGERGNPASGGEKKLGGTRSKRENRHFSMRQAVQRR